MKSETATRNRPGTSGAAPRTFEGLRDHIAARQADLPKRLAQSARFALAHPDEVALGTAASIAVAADVQPSTLVRLAHQLGYEGFSDFQSVFRERLKNRASTYDERLSKIQSGASGDSYEGDLLSGFLFAGRQSLDMLSETINAAEFGRCVSVLSKAETIYLIARRRAYPLIAQMSYAMAKLRIRAVTVDSANDIDPEIVDLATPDDAAIACSFSPYAPSSVELANALAANRVPLIALTDSALSPLAACATHWIEIFEQDYAGFRSLSASMAVAMALPVAIAERRRIRA